MNIGVIGSGNVGGALGTLWAAKNHQVVFGVRDVADSRVQQVMKNATSNVRAASVQEAAAFGEVIVLAVPWPAIPDAIEAAGEFTGRILVDCTNPLASDLSGLVLGTTTSAGEEVARLARGAKVVKAFNTIRNVSSHGMPLVPMNSPFALLHIDGIGRQVPVVDDMAVWMKIEPLLADRCRCKDERTEWRIEGLPHVSGTHKRLAVVIADIPKAYREMAANRELFQSDMPLGSRFQLVHPQHASFRRLLPRSGVK